MDLDPGGTKTCGSRSEHCKKIIKNLNAGVSYPAEEADAEGIQQCDQRGLSGLSPFSPETALAKLPAETREVTSKVHEVLLKKLSTCWHHPRSGAQEDGQAASWSLLHLLGGR
jgi:hypothetical protein